MRVNCPGEWIVDLEYLDVKNRKPHLEPISKILDFFGIEPEECFYVGDSEVDFEVCLAAGVPLIAYKNKALKAHIHVESLAELKEVINLNSASILFKKS